MLTDGVLDWNKVLGHRQVTDVYLLSLAVHHGGRFVTFDQRIVPDAVQGAISVREQEITNRTGRFCKLPNLSFNF